MCVCAQTSIIDMEYFTGKLARHYELPVLSLRQLLQSVFHKQIMKWTTLYCYQKFWNECSRNQG